MNDQSICSTLVLTDVHAIERQIASDTISRLKDLVYSYEAYLIHQPSQPKLNEINKQFHQTLYDMRKRYQICKVMTGIVRNDLHDEEAKRHFIEKIKDKLDGMVSEDSETGSDIEDHS